MEKREGFKRYLLLTVGLFFSALGVALTKHGELGVSPISSVANVMSYRFPGLSLGTWLIIWNCVLILGQLLILRRNFQPIQLLQIPLSFVFGWFTDLGTWMVQGIPVLGYPVRIGLVAAGTVVLGFGICLTVIANVVMNAGEAFVKAVSDTTGKVFGNVKITFDCICVGLSIVLSLLLFQGEVVGTREGTVLAALCTGVFVNLFSKYLSAPLTRYLTGGAQP